MIFMSILCTQVMSYYVHGKKIKNGTILGRLECRQHIKNTNESTILFAKKN